MLGRARRPEAPVRRAVWFGGRPIRLRWPNAAPCAVPCAARCNISRTALPSAARYFQKLVDAYEKLDPESGFANLVTLAQTQITSKHGEKRAFEQMVELVAAMKQELDDSGPKVVELSDDPDDDGIRDNLSSMYALHSEASAAQQHRLVAADVFHFTLASQV